MTRRRIYRALNPPFGGGKEYYDVDNTKEAIDMTAKLNSKTKKKDWVWA